MITQLLQLIRTEEYVRVARQVKPDGEFHTVLVTKMLTRAEDFGVVSEKGPPRSARRSLLFLSP